MKSLAMFCAMSIAALGVSNVSFAKDHPLKAVKESNSGSFSGGGLPAGYTAKELHRRPKIKNEFKKLLAKLEVDNKKKFKEFVLSSDEWDHLSKEDRVKASENATEELGSRYVTEIRDVWSVSKDGKVVGYVYNLADHVEAHIIQDGAGIVVFLDPDFNEILLDEWSA